MINEAIRKIVASVLADLNLSMPVISEIEVTHRIREENAIAIILLPAAKSFVVFNAVCQAGLLAYLIKSPRYAELVPAIKVVMRGVRFVSPGIRKPPCKPNDPPEIQAFPI